MLTCNIGVLHHCNTAHLSVTLGLCIALEQEEIVIASALSEILTGMYFRMDLAVKRSFDVTYSLSPLIAE